MAITFDPAKRDRTLAERGLDFADADHVFSSLLAENRDARFDYGEERWITVGLLRERMVVLVWTWRGEDRHVISMRKANERERIRFSGKLD